MLHGHRRADAVIVLMRLLAALLVAWGPAECIAAQGGGGIPAGPDAKLGREVAQAGRALQRRWILEEFERNAPNTATWYDDAHRIIEWWIDQGQRPGVEDRELRTVTRKALNILNLGVDQPEFMYATARISRAAGDLGQPLGLMRRLGAADRERVSGYLRMMALAWLLNTNGSEDQHRINMRAFGEAIADLCAAPKLSPSEEQYILRDVIAPVVSRRYPLDAVRQLSDRINSIGKEGRISEWVPLVVKGQYHIEAGWQARGNGFADTVTEQGWRDLYENLDEAEEALMRAHRMAPDRPEAAREMITVAMARGRAGGKTEREWFDEAVRAEFDYLPAYRGILWAMRPRWGGSHFSMYSLGLEAAHTKRFDTVVPMVLLYAIDDIAGEEENFGVLSRVGVWNEARAVLDGYLALNPPTIRPAVLHHRYALYAWVMGEYPLARQHYELAKDEFTDHWFALAGTTRDQFEKDLATMSLAQNAAALVLAGEGYLKTQSYELAVNTLRAALAQIDDADPGRARVEGLLGEAELLLALESEEGVRLDFTSIGGGWESSTPDEWTGTPVALTREPRSSQGWLLHRAPIGNRWELRGRVKFINTDFFSEPSASILFMAAGPESGKTAVKSLMVRLLPGKPEGVVIGQWPTGTTNRLKVKIPPTGVDYIVRMFDDEMTVAIDGEVVYRGLRPAGTGDGLDTRFGFGVPASRNPTAVAFSDLHVRRLEKRPADF